VLHVDRRVVPQSHADGIRVAAVRRPMHTGLPMVSELRGDIHASLQQKLDNVGAAVLARPCEAVLHLFLRGVRREPAVRIEKCLDDVETTDAGGGLEIQSISASGEELGGAW